MNDKKDLTRIEDLSEFLHQDDPEVENKLKETTSPSNEKEANEEDSPSEFNEFRPEGTTSVNKKELVQETPPEEVPAPPVEAPPIEVPTPPEETPLPPEEINLAPDENENKIETPPEVSQPSATFDAPTETEIAPLEENKIETPGENTQSSFTEAPSSDSTPEFGTEVTNTPFPEIQEEEKKEVTPPPRETRETFSDVRKFASNIVPGLGVGSGPFFSVLAKNIRFTEDAEDIFRILTDLGAINDSNKTEYENSLKMGNILLSQLSEFAAITLAHKIRRFDLDLEIGPSEEIHPSKFYQDEDHRPVTKSNFLVNREEHHEFAKLGLTPSDIVLTTQSILQNHQIVRYLGIVSEHLVVNSEILFRTENEVEPSILEAAQTPSEEFAPLPQDIYQDIQNALKNKALKLEGNAVIGVTFQLTPLPNENEEQAHTYYHVSCTGNVVWATPLSLGQL